MFILFSIIYYVVFASWGHIPEFFAFYLIQFAGYQWFMIAALPLILLYNGKKGIGLKYFFYIFYPAHIIILYFIGMYLLKLQGIL
ncbi:TraX family protein [Oceanobacillus sp. J11TS1]|uniref:TraX family protein n=1 Tax=Oceanobacillus sp. J11TS1 TaxID=2807191 RepID=UPI001FD3646F|nr:TraX family protein [Oceanobacillus sp. J11TS1]